MIDGKTILPYAGTFALVAFVGASIFGVTYLEQLKSPSISYSIENKLIVPVNDEILGAADRDLFAKDTAQSI